MSLLVDTSVCSLALRRDAELQTPEVAVLRNALLGTDQVFSTGLVLQELLQGFAGPQARDSIANRFTALAFIEPDRQDQASGARVMAAEHSLQCGRWRPTPAAQRSNANLYAGRSVMVAHQRWVLGVNTSSMPSDCASTSA